ncbi:RecX family transcriptional regulator [Aurantiacibacter spongiae]|uniref:Regulatory protein RecX n=1 Tax=Aurantiacibacter spongiae TaxID=2488860 RepID=A0A3N5DK08_9SPHN|nr:RecX family transcriptional regulator [Aurantiacibacter spongiae]RPF71075.1 hypothetical protein EG799_05195 [Aurantiacibacter spongiae]
MPFDSRPRETKRRQRKPLDAAKLDELALAYVARFATSARKLEQYLVRKLRERGWEGREEGEPEPDVGALVARYVERGYVDDEVYARAKAGDLLRRGYGGRRVRQALGQAGIAEEIGEKFAPGERAAREAALHLARRRRFGPFGAETPERDVREKQIAAMLRAGHSFESARELVEAPSEQAAREWVREAGDAQDS